MKKRIQQNGHNITSIGQLVDGLPVRVWNVYTVEDLPEYILVGDYTPVPRDTWCNMVRVFAIRSKIPAIKWVRQIMNWGLKDAKFFVDGLLEKDDWISIEIKMPFDFARITFKDEDGVTYLGEHQTGNGWVAIRHRDGHRHMVYNVTHWKQA